MTNRLEDAEILILFEAVPGDTGVAEARWPGRPDTPPLRLGYLSRRRAECPRAFEAWKARMTAVVTGVMADLGITGVRQAEYAGCDLN